MRDIVIVLEDIVIVWKMMLFVKLVTLKQMEMAVLFMLRICSSKSKVLANVGY